MKKIISTLLCAVLFLGTFSVMPVLAAGEAGGIDYSLLLDLSGGASYPVQLNFDGLTFDGTISRSGVPDEEREKIIEEVLEQMKLTREDIGNAHKVVNLVRAKKSWGEILQETRKTFEKMLGVPDIVDVVDSMYFDVFVYDGSDRHQKIQQGLRESEMTAYQISVPEAASAALNAAERIAKLKGKQILTELFSLAGKAADTPVNVITTMWDAMRADQKKAAEKTASYAMREIIYEFYNEVNRRIRVKDWKNDWKISINDADGRDISFMCVEGCRQTFTVDMKLTNKNSSSNSYPNGVYTGKVKITIEHELSPFDRKLLSAAMNASSSAGYNEMNKWMEKIFNAQAKDTRKQLYAFGALDSINNAASLKLISEKASFKALEQHPITTITRTLTKKDFTVNISGFGKDKKFNVFYPGFDGFEDEIIVTSTHEYELKNSEQMAHHVYDTDKYHYYYNSVHFMLDGANGDVFTEDDFALMDDTCGMVLYGNNLQYAGDIPKAYERFGEHYYMGVRDQMYPTSWLWDYTIWEKWDSENKHMTVDLKGIK